MPPAVDIVPHAQDFGLDNRPAAFLSAKVGARQEDLPHGDQLGHVGFMARPPHLVMKERHRDLHMDTRAIAGLAIGIDGATVPDRLQRVDASFHHAARRLARDCNNQTYAAGRMLIVRLVEAVLVHPCALGFFSGNPGFVIYRHDQDPPSVLGSDNDDI
jgi:hypothetical protein